MIFIGNHYIAQVFQAFPTFGFIREQGCLKSIEFLIRRGSRKTTLRTASTTPLEILVISLLRLTWQCVVVLRCAVASMKPELDQGVFEPLREICLS